MVDTKDTSNLSFEEIIAYAKDLEFEGQYKKVIDVLMPLFGTNMHVHRATAHNMVGLAMRMLRDFEGAKIHYDLALKTAEHDNNRALAHINMADIYRAAEAKYGFAHISLDDALTFAENGSMMHAKAVDQRGLIFVGQKDLVSAVTCYWRAEEISCKLYHRTSPDSNSYRDVVKAYANALSHYADACILLPEQMEKAGASVVGASEKQEKALELHTKIKNNSGIANSVTGLGRLVIISSAGVCAQMETIKQYYDQAAEALKNSDFTRAKAALHLNYAELYLHFNRLSMASTYLSLFVNDVESKQITPHDVPLMQPQFERIHQMYQKAGLDVFGFEKVVQAFAAPAAK